MKYFIVINSQKMGPFEVSELLRNGATPQTLVWCDGMPDWLPATDVPETANLFGPYTAPQPFAQKPNPQPQQAYPQAPQMPKTWLIQSILVTLFCCLPFGIVGIIKSSNISILYAQGLYDQAELCSKEAGKWTKIGFWIGLIGVILYIIFMVIAVTMGYSMSAISQF